MIEDGEVGDDIRKARDLLQDAVESLSEGFALYDDDRRLVMCNESYRRMNRTVSDILEPGLDWEILMRESARRGVYADAIGREEAWISERLENGVEYIQDYELSQTDGTTYLVSVHPTKLGGFVVTRTDITEKKQAEVLERDGDQLVRQVLESSPAAVVMARVGSGEIIYRSPAAMELFGKVKNDNEYYVDPADRADYITVLLADGRVDELKLTLINADGDRFPAAVYGRLAEYKGEEVIVSNANDLTEELALQEELASQREMLFQNEKMSAMGELLAGVAHELNNPLSIVVGHSLMLREESGDPETLRRVEKIGNAAERCAKIVKTFLAMARQQPAKIERVDIASIIATAVDVAGFGDLHDGIEIVSSIDENGPDVLADADQLTQVIINLVINAGQAIGKSGIGDRIEVSTGFDAAERVVKIVVADDGPGVPENIRARIFEPFFTTKKVGDGTGIGLAFCHRIIHSHKGRIWLDQSHEQGSRFCITLPVVENVAESDEVTTEGIDAVSALSVLVVDDEEDVADFIGEVLARDGYTVEIANSGAQAIARLETGRYDVLLSDLNMPDVDGGSLYEALEKDFPEMVRRTGFVTGDTMGKASQAVLQDSQRPYLEKPVLPDDLRRLIQGILNDLEDETG